jgi:hypothetical protein
MPVEHQENSELRLSYQELKDLVLKDKLKEN